MSADNDEALQRAMTATYPPITVDSACDGMYALAMCCPDGVVSPTTEAAIREVVEGLAKAERAAAKAEVRAANYAALLTPGDVIDASDETYISDFQSLLPAAMARRGLAVNWNDTEQAWVVFRLTNERG
jgi:hypothetical protein